MNKHDRPPRSFAFLNCLTNTLNVFNMATINKAKKSIASFKIRDGMSVGSSVTLRKVQMYTFLTKLIHIILKT